MRSVGRSVFVCIIVWVLLVIGCGDEDREISSSNPIVPTTNTATTVIATQPEKKIAWSFVKVTDDFSIYVDTDEGSVYLIGKDRDLGNLSVRIGLREIEEPRFPKHVADAFFEVADLFAMLPEFGTSIVSSDLKNIGGPQGMFLFVSAPGAYEEKGAVCFFIYHSWVGWVEIESARLIGEHPEQRFGLDISVRWKPDAFGNILLDGLVVDEDFYLATDFLGTKEVAKEVKKKIFNILEE